MDNENSLVAEIVMRTGLPEAVVRRCRRVALGARGFARVQDYMDACWWFRFEPADLAEEDR